MGFVYAISHPLNPRVPKYIGITRNTIRKRLGQHIAHGQEPRLSKHPFYVWLNSVLDEGLLPVIYVLENCEIPKLQDREIHWIKIFKPFGLLNRSEGKGTLGMKLGRPSEKNIQMTIARNKRPKTALEIERARERQRHLFRPIISLTTGQRFESIAAAERALGVYKNSIKGAIKHGWKCKGHKFSYV